MKINYKVLWIEDNFHDIKPHIMGLEKKIKRLGFNLTIEERESLNYKELEELNIKLSAYNPYDMIIFDYDLGKDNDKGDEIARNLRKKIYTDMIFYSGTSHLKLREALFKKEVDGVYVISRGRLVDEAWPIIEDQIKKTSNINNMRGVILDEMSKIDLKMRELYTKEYDKLSKDQQKSQFNKLVKKIKGRLSNSIKNIDNEGMEKIIKILESLDPDLMIKIISNPKKTDFDTVRTRLIKLTQKDIFKNDKEMSLKQDLRNKFAHNEAKYNEEKGTISLIGYDEEYDFNKFTTIRVELIGLLSKINNLLGES